MATIGFLSDAHGNGPALDKALDLLVRRGAERIFFLGDALGYIPSTSALETLMLASVEVSCVIGNHDHAILHGRIDLEKEEIYRHGDIRKELSSLELNFLSNWPESRRVNIAKTSILMLHGSPVDPMNGYIYPDSPLDGLGGEADFVFMGHTHRPFVRTEGTTTYVNVGSCGMPRDDGRFGAVALLDTERQQVKVLRFDIGQETALALKSANKVSEVVRANFARRSSCIFGEMD